MTEIRYIKGQADLQSMVLDSSNKAVILDFYADWCPPCKKLGEKLAERIKTSNGWTVCKIDVDNEANAEIAQSHNVSGIPAVYLYINGKQEGNFVGLNEAKLDEFIAKAASQY